MILIVIILSSSGKIENIVDFGAFIDIGVGNTALLHVSQLSGVPLRSLSLGDIVNVQIVKLDVENKKIEVKLQPC